MKEYLIKDYTGVDVKNGDAARISVVKEIDIFEFINNAKEKELKIVILEIGIYLIDWS